MKLIVAAATALAMLAGSAGSQPNKGAARPSVQQAQPLPRSLFISNMDLEFKKMDADHDGYLTAKEVEAYLTAQIIAAAEARKRALFTALDTDHDGKLTVDEFMRLPSNEPAPNPKPMIDHFDANHDGKVSLIEYRAGTLVSFDRLDTDKDGIVTPAEMKAGGIQPK